MKKILSLVLVISLVLGSFVPVFADSNEYGEQGALLESLGVLKGSDGDLRLNDKLTRQELMVMTARLMGEEATAENFKFESPFPDVDHPYFEPFIAWAYNKGLTTGYPDGTFGPTDDVSVQQLQTFLLRVLGYAGDWATAPEKAVEAGIMGDIEANGDLSRGLMSALVVNTLEADMADESETLAASLNIPMPKEAVSVATVALGTVDNGATLELPATVTVTYDNDTTEELAVVWADYDSTVDGNLIIQGTIEGIELMAMATVTVLPAELAVESITAINTKEIEVKFNKEIKAPTAADFEVKDKGTSAIAATPTLKDDNKTVVLTMDALTSLTKSSIAKVTVKKTVQDANGTALAADYVDSAITVFDGTFPTAVAVKAVGNKALEITFSEPIWDGIDLTINNSEFSVKKGTYTYSITNATVVGNTLTIKTGTTLQEGEIVVTYNKAAGQTIQDFAGNKAFKGEITLNYAKDTSSPSVAIKSVTQTEVVLVFDRPVYATDLALYHSIAGVSNYGVTHGVVTEANAAKEWTFTFGDAKKIPSGTVNLFLKNSTVAANQVTDLFGNKMVDTTLVADITVDTTAPTVASTKLTGATTYEITFSENLDSTEAAKTANYSVTDKDGKAVSFTAAYAAKKVTLTFALTDNADYEIKVLAAKDEAGNAMASEYVEAVNPGDNTNPDVSATTVPYFTDANTIYVVFTEAMDGNDLVNKSLYMIDVVGTGGTYSALTADDTVETISASKVKITIAAGGVNANTDLRIGTMKDVAGKVLTDSAANYYTQITNIGSDELTFTAETIAKNKVKLIFNKELSSFDNSEFTIAGATIDSIESMSTNSDGVTEVVLVLTTATVIDSGETPAITTGSPANTKSIELTVLKNGLNVTPVDKVAPVIDEATADKPDVFTYDTDGNSKIDHVVIQFEEAINFATVSLLTYEVKDIPVLEAFVSDAANAAAASAEDLATGYGTNGKFVVIKIDETDTDVPTDTGFVPQIKQALEIKDTKNNVKAADTEYITSLDIVVPTVATVAIGGTADDLVTAQDTITITFSEATDKPVITDSSFTIAASHTLDLANNGSAVWDTTGKVLTITLGDTPTLAATDTIAFAAVDTVEDAAGNDLGAGTVYTVPVLAGSDW